MALLEWKDEFCTGVRSIDYEHKILISSINQIFENSNEGRQKSLVALSEIHALIEAHFALEEKIMRDQRYPQYAPHKQDHENLLDDILDIMDDLQSGSASTEQLGNRLQGWFGNHFATFDRDLHLLTDG